MNRFIFLILLGALFAPACASAQCENPHAQMGVLIMNKKHKVMQYCNGDVWVGLWGGRGGSALPSCTDGEIAQFTGGEWQCNDGSGLDNLNASNLTSGTVPATQLGSSGTRDASTFLRGDNTWAAPPSGGVTQATSADCTTVAGWGAASCTATCAAGYVRSACYGYGWYGDEYNTWYNIILPTLSGTTSCTCSIGNASYYSSVTSCRIYCIK